MTKWWDKHSWIFIGLGIISVFILLMWWKINFDRTLSNEDWKSVNGCDPAASGCETRP